MGAITLAIAAPAWLLAGCGQKGPLYRPDPGAAADSNKHKAKHNASPAS
ncbi:MAG: LPS translocon maturation chaperone LptM [Gammaproteobacteria bacterium]